MHDLKPLTVGFSLLYLNNRFSGVLRNRKIILIYNIPNVNGGCVYICWYNVSKIKSLAMFILSSILYLSMHKLLYALFKLICVCKRTVCIRINVQNVFQVMLYTLIFVKKVRLIKLTLKYTMQKEICCISLKWFVFITLLISFWVRISIQIWT